MKMSHSSLPAGQSLLKLETNVVLPGLDEGDACLGRLLAALRDQKGVVEAHIDQQKLCLHYDPNLISVEHLQKLGEEAGAEILKRYDHLDRGTGPGHQRLAHRVHPQKTPRRHPRGRQLRRPDHESRVRFHPHQTE